MKYNGIIEGRFLARPNRFIALVDLKGETVTCHVKNTGRCKELLTLGASVLLTPGTTPGRRTPYDLVSVYKNGNLINMDSQASNVLAEEYLPKLFPSLKVLQREKSFGNSRFDFYGEKAEGPFYLEVKGVTLERDGIAYFPDAPTERGQKHLRELIEVKKAGMDAYLLFVVQMKGVSEVRPNGETDPGFLEALTAAGKAGVGILAFDTLVLPEVLRIDSPLPVRC